LGEIWRNVAKKNSAGTHALPTRENKTDEKIESDAWGHAAADAPWSNTLVGALCFFFLPFG
jgi:hypothetical protein